MKTLENHKKEQGFSLVELMIGLVLGLITTGVIILIFISNHNVFRTDSSISRVQEDARFAQEYLGKIIRMAGYHGCLSKQSIPINNTLKMSMSLPYKFTLGIEGYDNVGSTLPSDYDELISGTDPIPVLGTDILIIRSPIGEALDVPQTNTETSVFVEVKANARGTSCATGLRISDICVGSLMMLSDCKKARVFQVSDVGLVSGSNSTQILSIGHATGTLTPGNAVGDWSPMLNKFDRFDAGSEINEYRTQTFYVGVDAQSNQRALYMKINNDPAEVFLDQVRDIQVTYGVDQNLDRQVENYVLASGISNWNSVVSVRVELLLYSNEANVVSVPQIIIYNGTNMTMPDLRWYLPVTVVSTLRNRTS